MIALSHSLVTSVRRCLQWPPDVAGHLSPLQPVRRFAPESSRAGLTVWGVSTLFSVLWDVGGPIVILDSDRNNHY